MNDHSTLEAASLSSQDMAFLTEMTGDVTELSRTQPGEEFEGFGANETGAVLIRPGGRLCYPGSGFWIRDYAMSLDADCIRPEEQKHALLLTAGAQQDGDWKTPTGCDVPHGSIPDHITLRGVPYYFPGSIDDKTIEGHHGTFGKRPPLCDHFFFVHMAWYYARNVKDASILEVDVNGRRLIDRLDLAFSVPPSRKGSHLAYCEEENRAVGFGFCDSIVHTGDLLFCSVLKFRAAVQMAELHRLLGSEAKAGEYEAIAAAIRSSIPSVFSWQDDLLRASTGRSCQGDVWGSAFAVYTGAIEAEHTERISRRLARAYTAETLAYRGSIRHVLTTHDFSEETAWELVTHMEGNRSKNRYQNGSYWGTATGWVCYAIARADQHLAARLAGEYMEELREGDFRKGPEYGSPWECMHPEGNYKQMPVIMVGVACPLAAFRRLGW